MAKRKLSVAVREAFADSPIPIDMKAQYPNVAMKQQSNKTEYSLSYLSTDGEVSRIALVRDKANGIDCTVLFGERYDKEHQRPDFDAIVAKEPKWGELAKKHADWIEISKTKTGHSLRFAYNRKDATDEQIDKYAQILLEAFMILHPELAS